MYLTSSAIIAPKALITFPTSPPLRIFNISFTPPSPSLLTPALGCLSLMRISSRFNPLEVRGSAPSAVAAKFDDGSCCAAARSRGCCPGSAMADHNISSNHQVSLRSEYARMQLTSSFERCICSVRGNLFTLSQLKLGFLFFISSFVRSNLSSCDIP